MSTFNDVIRFALYHSVADGPFCVNKAVAQVRHALKLLCFAYRLAHYHSAHASTSTGPTIPSSPRPPSPGAEGKQSTPTGSASGASTSPTNGKSDGATYFECLNCKRQVSWIPCVYPSIHFLQRVRQNLVNLSYRLHPIDMLLISPRVWGLATETAVAGHGTPSQSRGRWHIPDALPALPAHFSQPQRSGGDHGRSESPHPGSEGSDDSKPSTKGKSKGKAAKKGKSDSLLPSSFALVLTASTIDDGDFSIHRKRVGQFFSVALISGPDSYSPGWITSSYSEEIKEGKN